MKFKDDERYKLMHEWSLHFGYYDGRIDITAGDSLEAFTTHDAGLVAHAPLWGTKPGKEVLVPVQQVRSNLAKILRWLNVRRHNMHIALHPDGQSLCLFFIAKIRPKLIPITIQTVPVLFNVRYAKTEKGLRISQVDEWPGQTPKNAVRLIKDKFGWPKSTTLKVARVFGAVS